MADYWKSIPKWWCKYCRIYITDNKISRTRHETNPFHRRNMERFIRQISVNEKKRIREEEQAKQMVASIEKSAVEAYARDLEKQGKSLEETQALLKAARETCLQVSAVDPAYSTAPRHPARTPFHSSSTTLSTSTNGGHSGGSSSFSGVPGAWQLVEEHVVAPTTKDTDTDTDTDTTKEPDTATLLEDSKDAEHTSRDTSLVPGSTKPPLLPDPAPKEGFQIVERRIDDNDDEPNTSKAGFTRLKKRKVVHRPSRTPLSSIE